MQTKPFLEAICAHASNRYCKHFFSLRTITTYLILLLSLLHQQNANGQPPSAFPSLTFNSPVLISGTDLQANAVYKFPNVISGVDAHVTIMAISGGAWLSEIDNTTGAGYFHAFQPYVGAGAHDTSYIDWKFVFKKAGTFTDTILPLLAITGIDVDGNGSNLKEFIEASTPGSFALDQNTILNFTFDGVRSTAISNITNYPNIDTANRPSMFQMNFTNINTILYRNGAITTGSSQVRQTSIYFKAFFDVLIPLPVRLLTFNAESNGRNTHINWSTSDEDDVEYYVIQKSADSENWTDIKNVLPLKTGNPNTYKTTVPENSKDQVFYRLKLVTTNGYTLHLRIIRIEFPKKEASQITNIRCTKNKVSLQIKSAISDEYIANVYTMAGAKIMNSRYRIYAGSNQYNLNVPVTIAKGIYFLVISNKSGEIVYQNKMAFL